MPVEPLLSHSLSSIAMDVLQQGAMESALSDGKTSMGQGMVHFLQNKIDNLEGIVHVLFARQGWNNEGNPAIFPVTKDGGKTWTEMVSVNGVLTAHPGGRKVTSDSDICAFIELTSNQGILIEKRDAANPAQMRYVLIAGGAAESIGQYQGQDRTMVAQNQAGWDFCRATAAIV